MSASISNIETLRNSITTLSDAINAYSTAVDAKIIELQMARDHALDDVNKGQADKIRIQSELDQINADKATIEKDLSEKITHINALLVENGNFRTDINQLIETVTNKNKALDTAVVELQTKDTDMSLLVNDFRKLTMEYYTLQTELLQNQNTHGALDCKFACGPCLWAHALNIVVSTLRSIGHVSSSPLVLASCSVKYHHSSI